MATLRLGGVKWQTTETAKVRVSGITWGIPATTKLRVGGVSWRSTPAAPTASLRVSGVSWRSLVAASTAKLRAAGVTWRSLVGGTLTASTVAPASGELVRLYLSGDAAAAVVWRIVSYAGMPTAPTITAAGLNATVRIPPLPAPGVIVVGARQGVTAEQTLTLSPGPAPQWRRRADGVWVPTATHHLR